MSAAYYTKTLSLYTGVGALCVWDGTNLDAIFALVDSLAAESPAASVVYRGGELLVWDEQIRIGDAICASDDETPVRLPKIPKETLEADEFRVLALQYAGNLEEVMDFVGRGACEFKDGALHVSGMIIEDTDYVYSQPHSPKGKKDATSFEAAYTEES